mmetsp:Transcript_4982/g.12077  ORF Transcript_4982/g.12077 Transcript_4982/m.12077 type:complete len:168 (+) Transcript_4982:2530-3033(+)
MDAIAQGKECNRAAYLCGDCGATFWAAPGCGFSPDKASHAFCPKGALHVGAEVAAVRWEDLENDPELGDGAACAASSGTKKGTRVRINEALARRNDRIDQDRWLECDARAHLEAAFLLLTKPELGERPGSFLSGGLALPIFEPAALWATFNRCTEILGMERSWETFE